MTSFIRNFIAAVCLASVLSTHAADSNINLSNEASIERLFETCPFAFDAVPLFQNKEPLRFTGDTSDHTGCSISLKINDDLKNVIQNADTELFILRKQVSGAEFFNDHGFKKVANGTWKFRGVSFIMTEGIRFLKLSSRSLPEENGLTLVGQSLQKELAPNGGSYIFGSTQIVRETPDFFVMTSVAFQPGLDRKKSDAITGDLMKIVQSVHIKAN